MWVSTINQHLDRQIDKLHKIGFLDSQIFIDKKSGKDFEREQYQLLKQIIKRTRNNLLVIKSIDRLGRNYKEIQREWQELMQYTDIKILDMPLLDTTLNKDLLGTFISDLILQVLSFCAENERKNIRERQRQRNWNCKETRQIQRWKETYINTKQFWRRISKVEIGATNGKGNDGALLIKKDNLLCNSKELWRKYENCLSELAISRI